jgi:hypothetical protein
MKISEVAYRGAKNPTAQWVIKSIALAEEHLSEAQRNDHTEMVAFLNPILAALYEAELELSNPGAVRLDVTIPGGKS